MPIFVTKYVGETVNQFKDVSYPTGYTASNSVIIGYTVQSSYGDWYSNTNAIYVIGAGNYMKIKNTDADFSGQEIKIGIQKII